MEPGIINWSFFRLGSLMDSYSSIPTTAWDCTVQSISMEGPVLVDGLSPSTIACSWNSIVENATLLLELEMESSPSLGWDNDSSDMVNRVVYIWLLGQVFFVCVDERKRFCGAWTCRSGIIRTSKCEKRISAYLISEWGVSVFVGTHSHQPIK